MIGIRFTNLIPGNYQINLFQDTQEMIKLYQAIDSVKRREGMVLRDEACLIKELENKKLRKLAQ
jgi:hypothetical protein